MSREINNRDYRQEVIRELLTDLHHGKSLGEVKARFSQAFDGVSAQEISQAEQALISGGMPVEEVQRLCDVHAAVFRDSLAQEAAITAEGETPGHPVHTIKKENEALSQFLENELGATLGALKSGAPALQSLRAQLEALQGLGRHYQRKENLFFPYMERHGMTAPPKVMWGVDDEIRSLIKQSIALAAGPVADRAGLVQMLEETTAKIIEMIFKEENIMIPMMLDALSAAEWKRIAEESDEIGYFLIPTPPVWTPPEAQTDSVGADLLTQAGSVILPTGVLQLTELSRMLDSLPIDITFVDKNDTVKYFSQGQERVFPRTKAVIGRNVANCHPPASVHIVEGILSDFKCGKKAHEDFWIKMGDKLIYIRYFAVRDEAGDYIGTLEFTQNIAPIQQISGEKRLVTNG